MNTSPNLNRNLAWQRGTSLDIHKPITVLFLFVYAVRQWGLDAHPFDELGIVALRNRQPNPSRTGTLGKSADRCLVNELNAASTLGFRPSRQVR